MADLRRKKDPPLVLRSDVYQTNPLMQARKVFDTLGMRIFALGLRGLNPHFSLKDKMYDEQFPELFIPTSKLVELLGGNTAYLHELKPACKRLFDTIIELDKDNGGFILMHLFSRLKYEPTEGLYLKFDESMRPYLLDLFQSDGYTKISVEQVFYLTSPYAWRLVELMLQYQNIPEFKVRQEIVREIDIEKLKFALNVPEDTYEGRIDNFRKKVLDEPIAEINEKTIYQMSYKVVKQGRRVTSFEFHMNMCAVPVEDERLEYSNNAIKQLIQLGFSLTAAQEILSACQSELDCLNRISTAQKILKKQKDRGNASIDNELGFLRTAIIENWDIESKRRESKRRPKTQISNPKSISSPRKLFEENRKKKEPFIPPAINPPKKQEISVVAREILIEMIDDPKNKKYVDSVLRSVGWTLKEFKEKYLPQK